MAKKIGAIISLSLIGVLIIATIVMANIKLDYSINCNSPIHVYVNSSDTTTEEQTKIVNLINEASKHNSLNALFNGSITKQATIEQTGNKSLPTLSGYAVEYFYNQPQDLMLGNKKYTDKDGKTYTYERLIFDVTEQTGEAEYKVYVIPSAEDRNTYSHIYTVSADFTELYNFLSNNF